ncbi:uncharacterized protein LOC114251544 [Bombyx mandarina]|uniref:Uncharacterized protein LOC114251544 n=1 Tax=Bombyx mandarina TaxID=7092 RepID=A0A6J2KNC5_BOMMA|nr:uncharacterized protein LOC114251544 [Bombyx mandarina]
MLASLKKRLAWAKLAKCQENLTNQPYVILPAFIGLFEDIILWKQIWLSVSFIIIKSVIFLVCVYHQINFIKFMICLCITLLCLDGFEAWLKYKHRTACLERLSTYNGKKIILATKQLKDWFVNKWCEFIYIRQTNHTKAFLLANIILGCIFFIGKYVNGYMLIYSMCLFVCLSHKVIYPVIKIFKNIQQDLESESELEGLIPEISDVDIQLLTIEAEQQIDEKQSYDYWKPEDIPLEEASDSSENSSLVTSFSVDKINTLEKDIETSDSSEDEYIPLVYYNCLDPQLQTTLEVSEPNTWTNSAYNTLWNFTGALSNMMKTTNEATRKRMSSKDSSDGFEIIDKNEFT